MADALSSSHDWVAFAPGERTFTGGVYHGGVGGAFHPSESTGRVICGAVAIVLNVISVVLWIRLLKKVAKT